MKIYYVAVYVDYPLKKLNSAALDTGYIFADPHEGMVDNLLPEMVGEIAAIKGYHNLSIPGDAFYYAHAIEGKISIIVVDTALSESEKRILFQNIETAKGAPELQKLIIQPTEATKSHFDKKVAELGGLIEEIKAQSMQNVETLIARGQRIEELLPKTEALAAEALRFRHVASDLKRDTRCPFFFSLYRPIRDYFYGKPVYSYEPEESASVHNKK